MTKIDRTFTATLERIPGKGGWTYVVMAGSVEFFGTAGLVKVAGTVVTSVSAWPAAGGPARAAPAFEPAPTTA